MYRLIVSGTVAAILLGTVAAASVADEFYWTDITTNEIRRAGLDGSNAVFVTGSPSAVGLAVDAAREMVYWTDDELKKIRRCNLDGTAVEDLVTADLITPRGIALDPVGYATRRLGKMYWTDEGTRSIRRADLDGRNVETLVTGLTHPREIALDLLGGKMYWADSGSKRIQRANLDGSVVQNVVASHLELPRGIALDMTARKVYWTDGGPDKIQRANLNGSCVEDLITSGLDIVRGIALDPSAGKMYFVDAGMDKIFRADLRGQGIEELRAGTPHPWSIALASAAPRRKPHQLRIVVDLDGSDRLFIGRKGARWVHRFWSWPKRVYLNGVQWNPSQARVLKNEAKTEFLAPNVNFASAKLTVHEGRDTAVLEHTDDGLILHLCDSPNGRQTYDMTITFGMKVAKSSAQDRAVADGRSYPHTVAEDRPVGYWRFEEPTVQTKAANLGRRETALDGTYVDVTLTPESATAALGKAAVFDRPTSRVELASKVSQWLNGTASLEFWIKTKQHGEGSWNAPAVFGADSNGDGNDLFWGTNSDGRVGVRRGDSGPAALTPESIHDNRWHHVVLIRDHESGVMKTFLDGRLVDTYRDAKRVPIKTTYGTIGQIESLPGKAQKLMATLDEVAIYDYVLSPRQVKRHWKAASRH